MTQLQKAAIRYAAVHGWYVHPLKPNDKTPMTANGLKDATGDDAQVETWWAQNPLANIGLNCGASGLVVLDFDVSKSTFTGGDLLAQLLSEYPTATSETGSGGYHLIYQQPEEVKLGNSRGNLPTGVDVRGHGGYIVLPPSIHPNGNAYKWAKDKGIGEIEIAPLPAFVLEMIQTKPIVATVAPATIHANGTGNPSRYAEAALNGEVNKLLHTTEGGRNEQLNKSGYALGQLVSAGVLDESTATNHLQSAAQAIGLSNREIEKTIQSGLIAGKAKPRIVAATIIDSLATVEQKPEILKEFALDHADTLAELDKAQLVKFCTELSNRGVSGEWLRSELRPAINELKRKHDTKKTWRDYVAAAEAMGYIFRLNDLADTVEVNGQRMSDVIEAELLSRLHEQGLTNAEVARRAFVTQAAQNRYHPVKAYLNALQWDGQDHISALAAHFTDAHEPITYTDGTERTTFHAWLLRWLIGAVAKVYEPQIAQNAMLVLDGGQGLGKSYFVRWICPIESLHFEGAIKTEDKDYIGYMTQYFVWEVGELGATIRKADHEALKAMITLQHAVYRPSYGRHALDKPALASLIGTVNFDGGLLNDSTGHRRFRPVTLIALDKNYSKMDVNQIWAQTVALYRSGESWQLTDEEKTRHAEITAQYEVEDVMENQIRQWFTVEPGNADLFTYTSIIMEKLRTYAGVKGTDISVSMKIASTLHKLKLAKVKRDNRWGYVGITFNEQNQPSTPIYSP